jgi:hypothetical protein
MLEARGSGARYARTLQLRAACGLKAHVDDLFCAAVICGPLVMPMRARMS